jgi:hypothetical protein
VQWAPADDLCVAGELFLEEPTASNWAITGNVVELKALGGSAEPARPVEGHHASPD